MVIKIVIAVAALIGGFVLFAATRPAAYHIERAVTVDAPATLVFAQIDDFKAWAAWSPWEKLDPQMQKQYEGPPHGPGASYAWQGNKKVGKGRMTVTETQPPAQQKIRLEFIEPFPNTAIATFTVLPQGNGSAVTWAMDGRNNLMGKMFGVFVNMDKLIGGDFERGLAGLKAVGEAAARSQTQAAKP